jgi:hypothetical protein
MTLKETVSVLLAIVSNSSQHSSGIYLEFHLVTDDTKARFQAFQLDYFAPSNILTNLKLFSL